MKKILLICLLLSCYYLGEAQEEQLEDINVGKHETLFGKARVLGGFGGPIVTMSKLEDEIVTSVGGGGGLIVNNFFVGLYGMGSTQTGNWRNRNNVFVEEEEVVNLAHGGLWLGYTLNQFKLVHLYSTVKLGTGAVVYTSHYGSDPWDADFEDADQIFAVSPEIGIELNIFKFFKIAFTGGYRWVNGVNDNTGIDNSDFNSATGSITFRFGGFGKARY